MSVNWSEIATIILWRLFFILITLLVFLFLNHVVLNLIKKSTKKMIRPHGMSQQRYDTLRHLFESLAHYVLYFITGYIILSILGVPMATLVAGAGIAGLIIGLGAQSFVNDLVNGVFILMEKQFDIDDYVIISNIEGRVTSIGLRLTTIEGLDGATYFIRNKEITIVKNLTRHHTRTLINLFIADSSQAFDIEKIIKNVNASDADVLRGGVVPTLLGLQTTPSGALYYSVGLFTSYEESVEKKDAFYQKYISALQQAGISVFQK
ncbi:mechanosensitive ion channel family protein [Carnobacteriaceae bacterium zg-ZUI252]|nr:mechanosensitive ion channel family protein [Carnobacteriaceae bacterium zg-ZUI252]